MFDFKDKFISSSIAKFKLYVDVEENNYDISGILLNECYGFIIKFNGIREMLSSLDKLFDYVNFPMTSNNERMFLESSKDNKKELPQNLFIYDKNSDDIAGKQPTFIINIQFRHNSTWQGSINWIEKNKLKRFKSELQLINLITDALGMTNKFYD